jgi:tetratricopeptide (TPR) repeat protein
VSDAAFHLVRTGSSLLRGSLTPYATSPGGEGSPILGALATALGASLSGGIDPGGADAWLGLTRAAAGATLGGCAAALTAALAVRAGRAVAALGVAFLVLPPAFVSSFALRPDAGAGGLLLTIAFARRSAPWAWVAVLATPVALPAATLLSMLRGRRLASAIAAAAVVAGVALLSLALPERRGEILRGLATGWGFALDGVPSTLDAIRRVWAGGMLVAAPLLLRRSEHLRPWLAMFAAAAILSRPEAFRAATPALVGPTVLLLVERIARIADPGGAPGSPSRPVLLALVLPLALLLLGASEDRAHRASERARTARLAQLGAFVAELPQGAIASTDTGTLAALSGRPILRLRDVEASAPRIVVFREGTVPSSREERRLFEGAMFLAAYAPLELRRGPTRRIRDAIWVRRDEPLSGPVPAGYARALRAAWAAEREAAAGARGAWDAAARLEPPGLGLAREALGVLLERAGDEPGSDDVLRAAVADSCTIRARGHLADRALSAFRAQEADGLIAQALRWNPHLAEVWGTRARLLLHEGRFDEAMECSARALALAPAEPRVLTNRGSFLWGTGARDEARELWEQAIREDARILRFLGDFRDAPDDAPAPPLLPLYSEVGFGRPPR